MAYLEPDLQVSQPKKEVEYDSPDSPHAIVTRLMSQSYKATKNMRQQWPDNYNFVVKGEQWSLKRPRWRFSEVVNVTWANIMTEVAIQTDGRPKTDYSATEPSDYEFATILKEINDINWTKPLSLGFGWERKLRTLIFQSKIYHVVHAWIRWNKDLENGIGDVEWKNLDPYGCFWDPLATHIGEARYFIYAEPMPTKRLKSEYPDKAEKITSDVSGFGDRNYNQYQDYNVDRAFRDGTFGGMTQPDSYSSDVKYGGEEMTLVLHAWIKDEAVEEKEDEDNGKKVYVKKLKYPKGRYIKCTQKCTLEDGENEYSDGLFPIATLVNYDYGEYAGENEVTHQRGNQKLVNYVLSHIMDQFKMGANPQKIVTLAAQDVVPKLTNEPGLAVVVPNQGDVRFEPGVGIAPGSFQLLDSLFGIGDKVQGLQDASRGANVPSASSGLMLEGFVEAAQTRPRLKNRSVDEFLTQVAYLNASRYFQFYRAPRVFRITNKQGWPEYMEFFIADDGAHIQKSTVNTETKQVAREQPRTLPAKGLPDVNSINGSALPFARAQKMDTAMKLFSQGAITLESLLQSVNWPNWQEEADKIRQQMAEQQKQQEIPK